MAQFFASTQNDNVPAELDKILNEAKKKGEVDANITGEDLIIHIYGMCVIPYLGLAYIQVKEKRDDEAMKVFLRERKEKIKIFVLKGIRP
jgi:hypothetical protein